MKKYSISIALLCLLACNNSNSDKEGKENGPAAIEGSTQHPNGITNGSVISRDTSAMQPDSLQRMHDSMPKR
jgi:hypothetical protein